MAIRNRDEDERLIANATTKTNTPPDNESVPETGTMVSRNVGGSGTSGAFGYGTYKESQAVTDARNALTNYASNPIGAWTGGSYGAALQQAIDKIVNRADFSYDMNADALYQQYKDKYIGLGKMAMQDTMGQASAMTGGYGNSYAQTAGNQSYQGYLQELNDVVPELYQLAYDKYNQEGQDLLNEYNMYNTAYNNEYSQYRDRVNDWYNEYNRLNEAYYNAYNQDYGLYSDNYSRALQSAQYNKSAGTSTSKGNVYRPAGLDDNVWNSILRDLNQVEAGSMSQAELESYLDSLGVSQIDKVNLIATGLGRAVGSATPTQSSGSGGSVGSVGTADTQKINDFKNSIMPSSTFNAKGGYASVNSANGINQQGVVKFKSYNDYTEAMARQALASGKLGEAEVEEILKEIYGI